MLRDGETTIKIQFSLFEEWGLGGREENRPKHFFRWKRLGVCPPCAVKTCVVRPVFARVVGELRAADPSNIQGPIKQHASPREQSEGPRPKWKPGQEQNPGPENQDNQHMLEQPRGSCPERHDKKNLKVQI